MVVAQFVNENLFVGVGYCEVVVLVLRLPCSRDAAETRTLVAFSLHSFIDPIQHAFTRIVPSLSLLIFLQLFILIKQKLHFMDLIERIFQFLFDIVLASGFFREILLRRQGTDQFVVFDDDQFSGGEDYEQFGRLGEDLEVVVLEVWVKGRGCGLLGGG